MSTPRRTILGMTSLAVSVSMPLLQAHTIHPATLPRLPYPVDALEPFLDAETMAIHHGRHHQGYVDNLNKAFAAHPSLARAPVETLVAELQTLPESVRDAVRNNGGGHLNHSLFWQSLSRPKPLPKGRLQAAVSKSFGSQTAFEDRLKAAGLTVFGSGWVWVVSHGNGGLTIETAQNQDSPWMRGKVPLLGLDVWEHAYYLRYQSRRADYLTALVRVVNWEFLTQRYEDITK